jgi:hypothetical protein
VHLLEGGANLADDLETNKKEEEEETLVWDITS